MLTTDINDRRVEPWIEEPLTVQVYQSAAVVTGVQAPGGARRVRFVRLWVRDGRDWKIAIHHGTTIAQAQANATPVGPAGRTATPLPALSGEEAAVFSVQKARPRSLRAARCHNI